MLRRRFGLVLPSITAVLMAALAARGHGQSAPQSGVVVDYSAPPAIDRGLAPDLSRSPDSPETATRRSIRVEGLRGDRVGASGAPYVPGKLIVKFRDGVSSVAKVSALSGLS